MRNMRGEIMKNRSTEICQRPRGSEARRAGLTASALLAGALLLLLGGGAVGPAWAENGLPQTENAAPLGNAQNAAPRGDAESTALATENAAPYQRHELPCGISIELPADWKVSTDQDPGEEPTRGISLKASPTKAERTTILLSVKDNKAATELGLFVRGFMVDKSYRSNLLPPWDIQSENLRISWKTNGTVSLDGWIEERHGTAIITANGKEFYKIEQGKTILPWNITLTGDKFGVQVASIIPPAECFGSHGSGSNFDFKASMRLAGISLKQLYKAPTQHGSSGILYKISFPGKRDALAAYCETSGSGGTCSSLYLIYFKGEEKLSSAEYQALAVKFLWWWAKDGEG